MKLELKIVYNDEPDRDAEASNRLILGIHNKFPEAVWERRETPDGGYNVFI
jgi:hypothetical protein